MSGHVPRPWPGALEWGEDWLAEADEELRTLGFVLRDGSRPGEPPGPRLLVAFRAAPTLEHFDPEEATFWEAAGDQGRLARLDRSAAVPTDRPFSWGRIRVTDRVPVSNQFLGFGGRLLADVDADGTLVAAFTSPAPIVRWAGHSQGVDPLADEVGAFFARLMVPVDFQAGAEARIAATPPEALYAAFLAHAGARFARSEALRAADPAFAGFVARERSRVRGDAPAAWAAGEALLASLDLA